MRKRRTIEELPQQYYFQRMVKGDRTKWYGQNSIRPDGIGQNGSGQKMVQGTNGTDKIVRKNGIYFN